MAERYPGGSERRFGAPETEPAKRERLASSETSSGSEKAKHKHLKNIEHARRRANEQAAKAEAVHMPNEENTHKPTEAFVNRELKEVSYNRLLTRTRKNLSTPGRMLSRIIHQPAVDVSSEALAKTVARPSGILGGGLLALLGTLVYFYITKHYGYSYNFFIFLLLLSAGFVAGWLVEILWRLTRR